MTEYEILIEAQAYKNVDLDFRIHELAYLTMAATAKKSAGRGKEKPAYRNFRQFYDYDKELRKIKDRKAESSKLLAVSRYMRDKENEVNK